MKRIVMVAAALAVAGTVLAAEQPAKRVPETAQTVEAIKKAVADAKGFGYVQSVQFDVGNREIIVLWYCPFSGRAACYVHGYYYDPEQKKWVLFLDDLVEGTHDLSVSLPCGQNALVIYNHMGKEVRKVDVSKVPGKKDAK